jgi:hypothetical protein
MDDRTKRAAIAVGVRRVGGHGLPLGGGPLRADHGHCERIGGSASDSTERPDRRGQLRQNGEQHDWNNHLQPPSHDSPAGSMRYLIMHGVASPDQARIPPQIGPRNPRKRIGINFLQNGP